jgi:dienelactone hydrolase
MKATRRAAVLAACAALVIVVTLWMLLSPYWTAAALIMRAAHVPGFAGRVAAWSAKPTTDALISIPGRNGAMRARLFAPVEGARRAVLLVGGVHPDGIDEPRLMELADDLAATGVNVITPEIQDLKTYRLTGTVTDAIEDAATWTSGQASLADGMVGMIGVSFSGGLSIVAAGRPGLRDRVAFVLSFGGHGNLPRVVRYLSTGDHPRPHDYAVSVVLHEAADLVVPAAQVGSFRRAIEAFLSASAAANTDRTQAAAMMERARQLQAALPEPSATLVSHVIDRNVEALGAALVPALDRLAQDPALSPDRSPAPAAPVYLLHGRDDRVIPATESAQLELHLKPFTRVRRLESGFISHVDVAERPSTREVWEMVAFWEAALAERGKH